MNKWYTRMAEAMAIKDRSEREKAFDKLDEDLIARKKAQGSPERLAELLKMAKKADKKLATEIAETLSDVLMGLLAPAVRKVHSAHDRAEQLDRNLQVAFALAAYKADNGQYPAKLADLAPKYFAAVPGDVFNGKPLIYKPNEKGYLVYSVGQRQGRGRLVRRYAPGDDPAACRPKSR